MEVDGLPIWAKVGDLDISEEKLKEIESRGSHHDVMPEHSLLYTHRHFSFGYNGPHVVEVNMTSSDPQLVETGQYYFDWFSISRPIIFSISSSWVKSSIPYEKRFDRYLEYNFFESQIHWFSVFNSFMIVVFLAGLVALIMIRTLSLDYRRYTQESMEGSESISRDDSGWKRVHGDVFRACSHLPLYSVLIGNGAHIVYTVIVSLVLILTMAQYLGRKKYVECLT